MKRTCIATLVLLAASLLVQAETPKALPVGVCDFDSKDETTRELASQVTTLIADSLASQPALIPVERGELVKLLSEDQLGRAGTVQPENAAKIGRLTGAKVLVTGRVCRADQELVLVARIIGTETGRAYNEVVQGPATSQASDLATELAGRIATTIHRKAASLVAQDDTVGDHLDRMKQALANKRRPSVSLSITERPLAQAGLDSGAETELARLLRECGFRVVPAQSKRPADVELTGQAVSATGLSKGKLVSCKTRIELKAVKQNRDLLTVDRQTCVAVDSSEQTAAKDSLEHAVAELAERVVPQLAR